MEFASPFVIDTSTPESLERDFYAWLNVEKNCPENHYKVDQLNCERKSVQQEKILQCTHPDKISTLLWTFHNVIQLTLGQPHRFSLSIGRYYNHMMVMRSKIAMKVVRKRCSENENEHDHQLGSQIPEN
ncbi:hypothetical protein NECAME_03707 [Necator americanus]|uniref:Uncharacterized protein n=1 Tax=Necator americanus TaxID=51031 RepID=W2T158_NECAM|nr:hypothetical protein NECAME_03707 [Necator americanus]ETN75735.1 hypothetical protein NECAME_03707 [Necator americanus]